VAAAAALTLLVVVAGVAFAMSREGPVTTAASATSSATSAPPGGTATTSAPASSAPASSAPASTTAARRPPTLRLELTGTSYVRVRVAGRTLLATVLTKGQSRTFDQKALTVTVGNAAAVRATINGKLLRPGRTGQVLTFTARR
jgi:cytoskeletal protein RodZ